jgi:hypothetical protein
VSGRDGHCSAGTDDRNCSSCIARQVEREDDWKRAKPREIDVVKVLIEPEEDESMPTRQPSIRPCSLS